MKKIFINLKLLLFTVLLAYTFCIQGHAIKYTDGRFITNTKVHEFVEKMIVPLESYKEISGVHEICFNRIVFIFTSNKKDNKVKEIELFIPVIDEDLVVTFFIDLYPKKKLSSFDLVNLFLNSNEFNGQDFNFDICNSVNIGEWCGDAVNEYDDKFSVATDITENNWQEKFLDPDIFWGFGPRSLLFFEIRPGEKVFVEGYEE